MTNISVEHAVKKGFGVNAGALLITLLFVSAAAYLFIWQQQIIGFLILLLLAPVAGLLYRSIAITHWRIWAFTHVRNVHELQEKAIRYNIIPRPGSWFEKLELRTSDQKQQLAALERKFTQPDELTADPSVSAQTVLYYSKPKAVFYVVLSFLPLSIGVWMLVAIQLYLQGVFFVVIGAVGCWYNARYLLNSAPQLTLNDKGIQAGNGPVQSWFDIKNERVEFTGSPRNLRIYLMYDCFGVEKKYDIAQLNITVEKLEHLMRTYRARAQALT